MLERFSNRTLGIFYRQLYDVTKTTIQPFPDEEGCAHPMAENEIMEDIYHLANAKTVTEHIVHHN